MLMNLRKINILKKAMLDTILQNFTPASLSFFWYTKVAIIFELCKFSKDFNITLT